MATSVQESKLPLIVITGPTASGKTGLAVRLAQRFGGEVISADSRAIYRGMNIGTAKPTVEERCGVPHWGIDLVDPGKPFSASAFKRYALQKIDEIRSREKIPFLVGGTGLYVDAVVFDYEFGSAPNDSRRRELELMSLEGLHEYCFKNNIALPENSKNRRYVIRAIERAGHEGRKRTSPIDNTVIVGITTSRETLRRRIATRCEQIFEDGVVEEATILGKKYGWDNEAMTGNIYPLVRKYLSGELTHDGMVEKFTTLDWRLAKRQMTWLRRNPYIEWYELGDAETYLSNILAS